MGLLAKLSIKFKVTGGFLVMQAIVAVVAISALASLTTTESDVHSIAKQIQPAVLSANELQYQIERANSSLGFYLLSQEDSHKNAYVNGLAKVDEELANLQNLQVIKASDELKEHVDAIAAGTQKFKQYQTRMLELAVNRAENIPGNKYAAQKISPLTQQMLQQVSGMIQSESEQEASAERRKILIALGELRYAWVMTINGLRAYLAFRQASAQEEIQLYTELTEKSLAKLKENSDVLELDQIDALEQFAAKIKEFKNHIQELIKIHGGEQWRMDSYLIRTEVGPLVDDISNHVNMLVTELRERINTTGDNLIGKVADTTSLVWVLLGIGLVVGSMVAWMISRAIIHPLVQTQKAMDDIASGDGDLTQRLNDSGHDEIAQLARSFNAFAGIVQNMVKEVSGYTVRLAQAAERLTVVTNETSKGADKQLRETDEVATAVNEMAAAGQEVARNASAASDAAQQADGAANNGRQVVGETIEAIDTLASEVERAGQVIDALEKDSQSIGSVLDVIKGIAEQTNLLALNAAIEAARAGEQGRGFAVVADEVRTLASRTQQSTAEIQSMIQSLQSGARDAVSVMEQSRGKAEKTVGQAARAGTSLEEINTSVKTIRDLNSQIACAAEEQSAVAGEINHKVTSISEITDQTAAGAQQTASASNELNQLAEKLKLLVNQFKV